MGLIHPPERGGSVFSRRQSVVAGSQERWFLMEFWNRGVMMPKARPVTWLRLLKPSILDPQLNGKYLVTRWQTRSPHEPADYGEVDDPYAAVALAWSSWSWNASTNTREQQRRERELQRRDAEKDRRPAAPTPVWGAVHRWRVM